MGIKEFFPIWNKLTEDEKSRILNTAVLTRVDRGTTVHRGSLDCTGVMLIKSGQLRAYILSSEGRQVSVFRLFDHDMCLLTASCMISSIQFEIIIEAEKDTEMKPIEKELSALAKDVPAEMMEKYQTKRKEK